MAKLWVVGDSTLSAFDDKYYYPIELLSNQISLYKQNVQDIVATSGEAFVFSRVH